MKLQDLNVFGRRAAGSMGKAAERLNTVQPAIRDQSRNWSRRTCSTATAWIELTEYGRALLDCGSGRIR
jgi:DNA-binding transcriptional LysR family regulator